MRLPALTSALVALQVGVAQAAPVSSRDCAGPFSLDALLGHLVAVEEALRNEDPAAAHANAVAIESGLPCLAEVLPPLIAGRAYRAVGAGWSVADAPDAIDRASGWFLTAAELEPTFDYGLQDLPADHPVREIYRSARASADVAEVVVEGRGFASAAPHFLDGRRLEAPRARPDRPHLLQRDDGGVTTWLVQGADFPEPVLSRRAAERSREAAPREADARAAEAEARAAAKAQARAEKQEARALAAAEREAEKQRARAAREAALEEARSEALAAKAQAPSEPGPATPAASPLPSDGVLVLRRQRPPEKTPLLVGGGVLAVIGGGLYALALDARSDFDAATHQDDVHRHARQANRLVLASAAAIAVGAGTFTWGVVLDGGSPLPAVRFRF